VGGRDPAAVIDTGPDRALDVGERSVDDLDVEHRHEGAERGAGDGDPGLGGDRRGRCGDGPLAFAGGHGIDGRLQCGHGCLLVACERSIVRTDCPGGDNRQGRVFIQLRGSGRRDARRFLLSRSAMAADLVLMVGSADMPGRSRPVRLRSSRTIFTGMRCTILVKLPVALSGGSSANSRPLAGDRLSTWPCSLVPRKLSMVSSTGWPPRTWVSWVSLKLAT